MKVEKTVVTVGETPKEKCPTYEKKTPETYGDAFSLIPGAQYNDAQTKAIAALDKAFPDSKGEKGEVVANPIRDNFLGHFSYGYDLWMKAKTRRDFEKTLEDPSKAIVQGVKGMIASGFDAPTAYNVIKAQRDAKGLETPEFSKIEGRL